MKHSVITRMQTATRPVFTFVLFLFVSILVAPDQLNAQPANANPVQVKYIGTVETQPLFLIQFDNIASDDMLLTIKNEKGETMYTEKFRQKKFARKIQLEDADIETLTITLTGKKEKSTQVFQINRNVRVVEDLVVFKLR